MPRKIKNPPIAFTLVLKNSEWARGRMPCTTFLFNPFDSSMCCLGALGRQCGVRKSTLKLKGRYSVNVTLVRAAKRRSALAWLIGKGDCGWPDDSDDARELMKINDSRDLTDAQRLRKMRPIFARHGIAVEYRRYE